MKKPRFSKTRVLDMLDRRRRKLESSAKWLRCQGCEALEHRALTEMVTVMEVIVEIEGMRT